jgi:hypothetical protein
MGQSQTSLLCDWWWKFLFQINWYNSGLMNCPSGRTHPKLSPIGTTEHSPRQSEWTRAQSGAYMRMGESSVGTARLGLKVRGWFQKEEIFQDIVILQRGESANLKFSCLLSGDLRFMCTNLEAIQLIFSQLVRTNLKLCRCFRLTCQMAQNLIEGHITFIIP